MKPFQKKMRKSQKKALRHRSLQTYAEVDSILQARLGRRLFRLSDDDRIRLLTLQCWSERYKVTLDYIVALLVGYYAQRFARMGANKQGLGCRVSVLTGKKSEAILIDAIKRDFPEEEHLLAWRHEHRKMLLAVSDTDVDDEEMVVKHKTILDYQSPKAYVRAYSKRIQQKRIENRAAEADVNRRRYPYRDNPWAS